MVANGIKSGENKMQQNERSDKKNPSTSTSQNPITTNRVRKSFMTTEKSMTQQNFAVSSNINNIMARYEKTGIIDNVNKQSALYGDYSEFPSYSEALNFIHLADELFNKLPAKIRAEFSNDPNIFLEFANDPRNNQQMIDLGLIKAPEPSKTQTQPQTNKKEDKATNDDKTTNSEKPST